MLRSPPGFTIYGRAGAAQEVAARANQQWKAWLEPPILGAKDIENIIMSVGDVRLR